MVFFLFGPQDDSWAESWAIGNDLFTTYRALPASVAEAFDSNILSGENILWGSVGPNERCFFALDNNKIYRTRDANLVADVSSKGVDHLTFSPGGGWFIRYTDGTVRLSMKGTFPESFHRLAKNRMVTRGSSAIQESNITNVWFGAGETILIQFENGALLWEGLPDELSNKLREMHSEGWRISKNTCLSPISKFYYFIQFEQPYSLQLRWSYKTHQFGILTTLFVREVLEGNHPVSHTLTQSEKTHEDALTELETECRQMYLSVLEEEGKGMAYMTKDTFSKCVEAFRDSVPKEVIAHFKPEDLWDLVDLDHDGKYTLDEFTLAFTIMIKFWAVGAATPKSIPIKMIDRFKALKEPAPGIRRTFSIGLDETELEKEFDKAYGGQKGADTLAKDLEDLDLSIKNKQDTNQTKKVAPDLPPKNPSTSQESRKPQDTSNKSNEKSNDNPSSRSADEKQLRESLASSIVKENPNVQWDDVAGLENAKEELQEAVVLPIKFPQMFKGKRKPRRGILLYGPPGTGKSYLAKAVATEVESTLFSISSSDVMSKWYGESERLVKTLFEMARENKPSIIFIDELDALCGSRDSPDANEHTARMKTELMVQIDGVGNDNTGVLLLAATNLPWSLDPAMRRRFQRKIHIPLPDEEARVRMFEIHVGDIPCGLEPKDYVELGKRTAGLSGSDISIAVQDALMQPVKKISSSKFWCQVGDKWTPCKPDTPGATPMNWRKVPASRLLEPTVEVDDFFTVLAKVKPSVAEAEITKCIEWTKEFGLEGA